MAPRKCVEIKEVRAPLETIQGVKDFLWPETLAHLQSPRHLSKKNQRAKENVETVGDVSDKAPDQFSLSIQGSWQVDAYNSSTFERVEEEDLVEVIEDESVCGTEQWLDQSSAFNGESQQASTPNSYESLNIVEDVEITGYEPPLGEKEQSAWSLLRDDDSQQANSDVILIEFAQQLDLVPTENLIEIYSISSQNESKRKTRSSKTIQNGSSFPPKQSPQVSPRKVREGVQDVNWSPKKPVQIRVDIASGETIEHLDEYNFTPSQSRQSTKTSGKSPPRVKAMLPTDSSQQYVPSPSFTRSAMLSSDNTACTVSAWEKPVTPPTLGANNMSEKSVPAADVSQECPSTKGVKIVEDYSSGQRIKPWDCPDRFTEVIAKIRSFVREVTSRSCLQELKSIEVSTCDAGVSHHSVSKKVSSTIQSRGTESSSSTLNLPPQENSTKTQTQAPLTVVRRTRSTHNKSNSVSCKRGQKSLELDGEKDQCASSSRPFSSKIRPEVHLGKRERKSRHKGSAARRKERNVVTQESSEGMSLIDVSSRNDVSSRVLSIKDTNRPRTATASKTRKCGARHVCKICGKSFARATRLNVHKRTVHSDERPFPCQVCGKAFKLKGRLEVHKKSHSGEKPFVCSMCGKAFGQACHLQRHNMTHTGERPYACQLCNKAFLSSSDLHRHHRTHTGEKPFECKVCGKRYREKGSLQVHMRFHRGEKPYKCNICDKTFTYYSALFSHIKIHSGKRPYKCEVCGQAFLKQHQLRVHYMVHTGEKPWKCETCNKSFRLKGALHCHVQTHSGLRPYKCDYCGRRFRELESKVVHERTHTGEKPFKCDICNRSYCQVASLYRHRKLNNCIDSY